MIREIQDTCMMKIDPQKGQDNSFRDARCISHLTIWENYKKWLLTTVALKYKQKDFHDRMCE